MKKEQHKVKNKTDDIINESNKLTSCYVLYVTTDAAQNDEMDVKEHKEEKQGSLGKESEQKEKESEEEEKGSEEEENESEQEDGDKNKGDLKLSKKRKKKKEKRSTAQRKKAKKNLN